MRKPKWSHVLLALSVATALSACGGGNDDGNGGGGGGGGTPVEVSALPQSALQSVEGLVAYVRNVIDTMTSDTSAPIALGDVTLPTSETHEPLPVQ